jgi:hypothetical protein
VRIQAFTADFAVEGFKKETTMMRKQFSDEWTIGVLLDPFAGAFH